MLVKTRIHLLLKPADESSAKESTTERPNSLIGAQFSDIHGSAAIYGSWIMGRRAEAYSDFKLDAQGYSRFLVVSHALNPADAGRVVTRLLEMENYRITALIPLDVTRAVSKTLSQADAQLVRILDEIADSDSAETQHDLLNDLPGPPWLRGRSLDQALQRHIALPPPAQGDVADWLAESQALLAGPVYPNAQGSLLPLVTPEFHRRAWR